MLQSKTGANATRYVYALGTRPLAQNGGAWEYLLADALGSVRQIVDANGNVTLAKSYEPYGSVLTSTGSASSIFGYAGEQVDTSGLVFLRARHMQPTLGIFLARDPWSGEAMRPGSMNGWNYAINNPVLFTDRSGRFVDCDLWPTYLGLFDLQSLCRKANQDIGTAPPDVKEEILDAREQIYYDLANASSLYANVGGLGFAYVRIVLLHFLEGSGERTFHMSQHDPFIKDPGITRATTTFRSPQYPTDEPDVVIPLLYDFLVNYAKPAVDGSDSTLVGPIGPLKGKDHYFNTPPRYRGDEAVRPYDKGYWAAFGHVTIDGLFSAKVEPDCHPGWGSYVNGYIVEYTANYRIDDRYEWFPGIYTPLGLPFAPGAEVPHEWAISLKDAHRANEFDFHIEWTEKERLSVSQDFTQYHTVGPYEQQRPF